MLDFAGIRPPDNVQGRSFKSICETGLEPSGWKPAAYYRYWMHLSGHHIPGHYGVRDNRYKLAFFYGLPLDVFKGRQFETQTPAGWELYDLEEDPTETNNVYGKAEYAPVVDRLKKRLLELKEQYGDQDERYPELMQVREAHWNE